MHTVAEFCVAKPFTLVSTWDGDELSLIQAHHQLREARRVDVRSAAEAWTSALRHAPYPARGLGLYRVLHTGEDTDRVERALASEAIRVRRFPGGHLAFIPPLDTAVDDAEAVGRAFASM